MLRQVLGKGAPVAVGAAAAAPSTAQCRAQNSSRNAAGGATKTDREQTLSLNATESGLDVNGTGSSNEDWLLADVHQSGVLFSPEDVQDVVKQVMGFQRPAMVGCEVKEEGTSDSDASSATDANEYMAAADMQVMRCQQDRFNFTQSLINLVNQPEVQRAVTRNLVNDPAFRKLIMDENKVDDAVLYPEAARGAFRITELDDEEDPEAESEQENPIMHIAGKVAANLVRLGRDLREAAQDVLVSIGFQIHALLGRPFKHAAAADDTGAEGMPGRPDGALVGRLLMTVGCAVITILLFKRMRVA